MTVHIGPLAAAYAGEALTVQRAAYVTEAQQYHAPDLPPLTETVEELRADLAAVETAAPPNIRTIWLVTGTSSEASLRLYRRAGYAVVGNRTDAVGVAPAVLEKARSS